MDYKRFLINKKTKQLSIALSRKKLKARLGMIPEQYKIRYMKKKIELEF